MNLVFHNGCFLPRDKLLVPITDRGFLFGDGIFTTMHVVNGRVENIGKHFTRLHQNCRSLNIKPPEIKAEWINELVIRNNAMTGRWRLKVMITAGVSKGLALDERGPGSIVITMDKYTPDVPDTYRLTCFPFPVTRPSAKVKSLAYLDRLWIRDFAKKGGCHDALTATADGTVLETAFSNIFWVKDKVLYTPSDHLPLLMGTFLTSVIGGIQRVGYSVVETGVNVEGIPENSQVFICNAMMGVQPVDFIEKQRFLRDPDLERTLLEAAEAEISQDVLTITPSFS